MKIIYQENEWTEGKIKGFSGKELFNLTNGTLKFIRVNPHASYPEHLHPDKTEYAYVVSGTVKFMISNRLHDAAAGDFFLFPRNQKHAIINPTDSETILLVGAVAGE